MSGAHTLMTLEVVEKGEPNLIPLTYASLVH